MSEYFLACNGVKQGGVFSPVLFCLYVDGLLVALSNAGVGCFMGGSFVGALVIRMTLYSWRRQHLHCV